MLAERLGLDAWALKIAEVVALRATSVRRAVGCVMLNKRGHILSTGYNGRAAGLVHCMGIHGRPCSGANAASGTRLSECEAIHAEQNGLLFCRDVSAIETAVVTVSPCVTCTKLLLNTGAKRIVFSNLYADAENSRRLWAEAGREWIHIPTQSQFEIKKG
jgi:dCMP deaminase